MEFKNLTLLPLLLLSACISYKPDLDLRQPWSPEAEFTLAIRPPYALVYDLEPQKVIYVASGTPGVQATTNALIESIIEKYKPQIVLVQGHVGDNISPSAVKFKLRYTKPVIKGISAPRCEIVDYISRYNLTERDYEIFHLLILMNQIWQYQVNSSEELKSKAMEHLKCSPHVQRLGLTFEEIKKWFKEKTGCDLTEEFIKEGNILAPMNPCLPTTTFLQKMSSYVDEIDDAVALENLGDALYDFNTIMIIRAGSKYGTEKDVLHQMMRVSKPTTVIKHPLQKG